MANRLLALVIISGWSVLSVGAQTTTRWINAAGGSWHTAANWNPATEVNSATVVADFSTLALSSDMVVSLANNRSIGGFRFGDTDGTPNTIQISSGADNYRILSGSTAVTAEMHVATGTAIISNRVNLSTASATRKTGPGMLAFSWPGNSYGSNGLIMAEGTVAYGVAGQPSIFGAGMVYEGGTLLYPFGSVSLTHGGGQLFTVNPAGGTLIITNGTADYRINGVDSLRGSGTLVVRGGGAMFISMNQNTYFTGTLALEEGVVLRLGSSSGLNMSQGNVNLSAGTRLRLDGNITSTVARLTGTGAVQSVSSNSRLWVGDNGATPFSFMFSGTNDYSVLITKTGSSTMVLSGTNGLTGATTVLQGALLVNGLHTNVGNTVAVSAGATLGGRGSIAGAVTVNGVLAPGDGGIGTLTTSNVTWNGGASWSADTDWPFELGPANTSDRLVINGSFTKGGGTTFRFDFGGSAQVGTFTLVDWTVGTTFNASDFSYVNLDPSLSATFQVNGSQLDVQISSCATLPTITLGASPSLCTGTTSANLPYSAITESPDQYSIDYSTTANNIGLFTDVPATMLPASPIPLTISAYAPAGVYTGTLTVIKSATGCRGSTNFTVTVLATPATPGAITQGNPSGSSVCSGAAGVTYSISAVSMATTYTWGVPAGANITAGHGTSSITVDWGSAVSGNVTVNAGNTCGTSANQSLAVTVRSGVPVAPAATDPSELSTTSFVAQWGAAAEAESYRLDVSTDDTFSGGFVLNNVTVSGTSRAVTGLNSGESYFYRVRSYNACGVGTNSATITVLTPQVLAAWDFSGLAGGAGNYGASPLTPTATAVGQVNVVGWTRGAGVAQAGTAASRGWGGTGWESVSTAAAITANKFATHTIQAATGLNVSFYSIHRFDYRRDATGPTSWLLQYSLDGSTFVDIDSDTYASSAATGASNAVPIDLRSIAALQNVPDSVTVTFRLVNEGASAASGPWYLYDTDNSSSYDFDLRGTICSNPAVYNVTGGGNYCSGGSGVSVGLSGSELYVRYQLYRNGGATAVGTPVSGTGGAISFGLQTVADTYTVTATRLAGECASAMNGSAVVTITTTPGVPTGLGATPSSGQVELSWTGPGGATGYNVKRATGSGGPYSTLPAGGNVAGLTFTDTTALDGNTYYYTVSALNGSCEGDNATEAEAIMPAGCPGATPPTLSQPGNKTVIVGNTVFLSVSATDASEDCPSPTFDHAGAPSFVSFSDTPGAGSVSRAYTLAPTLNSQTGTYAITLTATDSDLLTTSLTFMVFVGLPGEPNNGTSTPPPSQTNWNVVITNLVVPSSGNATVVWTSVDGVQYDLYSSANPIGANPTWNKVVSGQEADGSSATASVSAAGSMMFYQVVPQGQSRTDRGIWGVVRQTIPSAAVFLMSPPLVGDRSLADDGEFGQALAAAVDAGTRIHIASDSVPNWVSLEEVGGVWRTVIGGNPYNTPLAAGQAFYIQGGSGKIPVFSGPVGNTGVQSVDINVGFNLIGVSEGKGLAASTAFESATPIGHSNDDYADQVVIQHANGTWRRLVRRSTPSAFWSDMNARGAATSVTLMPGEAYYYIRRTSNTSVEF